MTWFGDLDISWLTELPGGRKPIRTFIVPEADGRTMANMFAHLRQRIDAGERAYVVCPRIDADEDESGDASGDTGIGVYDESDAFARERRLAVSGAAGGAPAARQAGGGPSADQQTDARRCIRCMKSSIGCPGCRSSRALRSPRSRGATTMRRRPG